MSLPDHLSRLWHQIVVAAPSLSALVLAWLNVPLTTWQIRAGLAFLVLQALYLMWKWRNEYHDRKRAENAKQSASTSGQP